MTTVAPIMMMTTPRGQRGQASGCAEAREGPGQRAEHLGQAAESQDHPGSAPAVIWSAADQFRAAG